ncbi:hypothetical protein HDU97_007748 [Phlyctochytrium planicorne]|nr:hypothetical protein HDU97_007748 [Phlyctochytrium planicorne]
MLKNHNPALCTVCSKRQHRSEGQQSAHRPTRKDDFVAKSKTMSSSRNPSPHQNRRQSRNRGQPKDELAPDGLEQILQSLEFEYEDQKSSYNILMEEYESAAARPPEDRGESQKRLRSLGDQLRNMIQDMESKSEQIRIIRDIFAHSKLALKPDRGRPGIAARASHVHNRSLTPKSRSRRHRSMSPAENLTLLRSSQSILNT